MFQFISTHQLLLFDARNTPRLLNFVLKLPLALQNGAFLSLSRNICSSVKHTSFLTFICSCQSQRRGCQTGQSSRRPPFYTGKLICLEKQTQNTCKNTSAIRRTRQIWPRRVKLHVDTTPFLKQSFTLQSARRQFLFWLLVGEMWLFLQSFGLGDFSNRGCSTSLEAINLIALCLKSLCH